MTKMMKAVAVAAVVLAAAMPARAEVSIEMGVEGYLASASNRGALTRAAQLEKLSNAADALEAASDEGGARGETLLAGLYAGSVAAEKPAVYFEQAVPAPKHEHRSRVKAAVEELGDAAGEAAPAAEAGAAAADEPSVPAAELTTDSAADAVAAAEEGDAKPSLGSDLLAMLGTVLVMALLLLVIL
ncbi:MAG: hypothetical protein HY952_04555 [Elusimicrobia bacterium]|nr:hypothetical protein [Elusimicrobiota bacterium]